MPGAGLTRLLKELSEYYIGVIPEGEGIKMSKAKKVAALAQHAAAESEKPLKHFIQDKQREPQPIKFGDPVDELATLPVPEINPKDLDVVGEWNGGTAKYLVGNLLFNISGSQQARLAYRFVDRWFFDGLTPELFLKLHPKQNVVAKDAIYVLKMSLNSTKVEHSVKISAVAYMLSSWFNIEGVV